jgi:Protein of unknown function (DUF938)
VKLCWPAPERNKHAIFAVLRRVLPESGSLLELASGSGQHAAHFARGLPGWTWIPSDLDRDNLASIAAYRAEAGPTNLAEPRALDVCSPDWGVDTLDAAFNANMLHISSWACCLGLFLGLSRHLRAGGLLVLYGPFFEADVPTAPSNLAFDASLRRQNPEWGVRDLTAVAREAASAGLRLRERVAMPANNLCLVFERGAP